MPCYHPITAWQSPQVGLVKRPLHFVKIHGYTEIQVPCGQCIGCRLERSRQWAIRCVFEASLHTENVFVTLTYDNEHLPKDKSLCHRDFQLFFKRLRKELEQDGKKISYYMCGEYGDQFERPHYHACIFGHAFSDAEDIRLYTGSGSRAAQRSEQRPCLYVSKKLNKLWGKGYCIIGEVTFESAAYIARYCTKKITGSKEGPHYKGREPEYNRMSLKPAIGKGWFEKYHKDVTSTDSIVIRNNLICKPPKYYDILTEEMDKRLMEVIKKHRKEEAPNFSYSQLLVKESVKKNSVKTLKRTYENG